MSGWEIFNKLCTASRLELEIHALTDEELRSLRETLERVDANDGVPGLIDGLATIEAAHRWQGGGK